MLLEDVSLAVVPHGAFLLDRLAAAPPPRAGRGLMLAAGGVDYGPAPPPGAGVRWENLPATAKEAGWVQKLAAQTGADDAFILGGAGASTDRILADLPRVRYAHLATHGFFADERLRSALRLDAAEFDTGSRDLRTAGARNPLVLSGLVLAGANRTGPGAPPDRGLLTAEALASRRLAEMDLAVLSACESGLGQVAVGEGVFGLRRAFHLAGCRSVVASLWKVDDEATAVLMRLFYQYLWSGGGGPRDALRAAQLELFRNPGRIGELSRGVDLTPVPAPRRRASAATRPVGAWPRPTTGRHSSSPGRREGQRTRLPNTNAPCPWGRATGRGTSYRLPGGPLRGPDH